MIDGQMVLHLMKRLERKIVEDRPDYIEVDSLSGEDISFDFDEDDYHLIEFDKYIRN